MKFSNGNFWLNNNIAFDRMNAKGGIRKYETKDQKKEYTVKNTDTVFYTDFVDWHGIGSLGLHEH